MRIQTEEEMGIVVEGPSRVVLERRATRRGEIQLQLRPLPGGGVAYEIIANGVFLMASYNRASEIALADLALGWRDARLGPAKVLVGGLGMGFTLQAALADPTVGSVDVVEVEPAIVEWNQTHLPGLNGGCLADPRVRLVQGDVVRHLTASAVAYDAICLDVDNGPGWLASPGNGRLYSLNGLERLSGLLAVGGVLAVWSAAPARRFLGRLQRVFREAEAVAVPETDPWGNEAGGVIYRARH